MTRDLTAQLMVLQEGREKALAEKANQQARELREEQENIQEQIWALLDVKEDRRLAQEERIDSRNRHERVAKKWRRRAKRAERNNKRVARKAARQYRRSADLGTYVRVEGVLKSSNAIS